MSCRTAASRGGAIIAMACLVGCGAAMTVETTTPEDSSASAEQESAASTEADASAGAEVSEEAWALIGLIDSLDYPPVADREMVRVYTGRSFISREREEREETALAILIEETPVSFTVVHNLGTTTYERGPSSWDIDIRYEVVPWPEALDRAVATARAALAAEAEDMHLGSPMGPGPRLRATISARAAAANGYDAQARELLSLALQMSGPSMPLEAPDDAVAAVRGDLGLFVLAFCVQDYADNEVDRPGLRDRLLAVTTRFAGTEAATLAGLYLGVLERMIAEDVAHERDGPHGERARELVYQLREAGSARQDLDRMGLQAAPRLIEIFDDERLTRNAYGSVDGSLRWESYGEVARTLLRSLAGRRFSSVDQARTWWAEVQRIGEVEMLVRRVRAADYDSIPALEILLVRDRRRGVREGIALARRNDERLWGSVIRLLSPRSHSAPLRFFVDSVRRGPEMVRFEAALALIERNNDEWIEPIAEQLQAALAGPAGGGQPVDAYAGVRALEVLVEHGGERGVQALVEMYPRLRTSIRLNLLVMAGQAHPGNSDAAARINALLISAFDDSAPLMSLSGVRQLGEGCIGTVRDAAAAVLAERLSEEYECTAPPYERARRRVQLANGWRGNRGESPEPVPAAPPTPQIQTQELDASLARLRAARQPAEVQAVLRRLRAHGPGAAARLSEVAGRLPESHPGRAPAQRVAAQLASTIYQVTVEDQHLALPDRSVVTALQGQALEASALPGLLSGLFTSIRRGRVVLELHRDPAGRGVSLRLRTTAHDGESGCGCLSSEAELYHEIRRGEEMLGRDRRRLDAVEVAGMRGYRSLVRTLSQLLQAPGGTGGEAQIIMSWSH